MRLICPKCQARYQVPVEVIPEAGREVQCSNCGMTWFQTRSGADEDAPRDAAREPAAPQAEPAPDQDAASDAAGPDAAPGGDGQAAAGHGGPALHAGTDADTGQDPDPGSEADARSAPEPQPDPASVSAAATGAAPDPARPASSQRTGSRVPGDALAGPEAASSPATPRSDPSDDAAPVTEARIAPARARKLDPGVADVLRAEAEYEARHRAAESGTLESQPDLGLDSAPDDPRHPRVGQERERDTRTPGQNLRGASPEASAKALVAATERARAAASSTGDVGGRGRYDMDDDALGDPGPTPAETASRRGLLPDVDEINQSLRRSETRRPVETPQGRAPREEPGRSGFAAGFLTVLVIGIALIAVYLAAPSIAAAVPALADPLAAYVAAANAARSWLDGQVTALLVWLGGLGADATG